MASGDYSGVQFDISIPEGMTLDNIDLSAALPDFDVEVSELSDSQTLKLYRVSIYSSARNRLPVGKNVLTLELGKDNSQLSAANCQLSISNILFATSKGEDERSRGTTILLQSDDPTGIEEIGNTQKSKLNTQTYYDLQGRKISNLKSQNSNLKGLFIIDRKKIIVR